MMMLTALYEDPSFQRTDDQDSAGRILLTYKRANAMMQRCGMTLEDIGSCSPRFWSMNRDPAMVLDMGCANILACSYNLFLGVMAHIIPRRADLEPLTERALKGEIVGNFLLTEVGHGLDFLNLETTATMVTGGFLLNTPHSGAAKFMPPTTPICPKVAIVFARLLVNNSDRGVHPFLVHTSDENGMCAGVTSKPLPSRCGTSPLDYALTSFANVYLPASAFLGIKADSRENQELLQEYIWRTVVGQVTISLAAVTGMKMSSYIGVKYSFRRHVQGRRSTRVPIMAFRTQQLPMLYITAITHVLDAWTPVLLQQFTSPQLSIDVRRGLAAVYKITTCRFLTQCVPEVAERLGAQGTFVRNFVNRLEMDIRGFSIADGDITAIGIRLFPQLLLKKLSLPTPLHDDSMLSLHSNGVHSQCRQILDGFSEGRRDERFNDLILPQCQRGVLALGCAYAYGCAVDAGVPTPLLQLFECAAIKHDPLWYTQHAGLSADVLMLNEDRAARAALPKIQEYVDQFGVDGAVDVPILSDDKWEQWVAGLENYDGCGGQGTTDATVAVSASQELRSKL
ncbi:hypothetical protein DAEQUDRAFT_746565 [Daedalea quercina L-15889]|uniref:Acyl-CoA dehydrogenase NM domain-like protein n=1 Tax=Daedalea quercina L-15889 TaxID=1314783 RepID=A0A165N3B2_9APHY|nr:hypothetical protein DAEQUDRAFT_746565 [Daedalea quercina L-15889]